MLMLLMLTLASTKINNTRINALITTSKSNSSFTWSPAGRKAVAIYAAIWVELKKQSIKGRCHRSWSIWAVAALRNLRPIGQNISYLTMKIVT